MSETVSIALADLEKNKTCLLSKMVSWIHFVHFNMRLELECLISIHILRGPKMLMLVGVETVCHHNGGRSMLAYHHCGDNYITPATQSLNGFKWSNTVLLDHSTHNQGLYSSKCQFAKVDSKKGNVPLGRAAVVGRGWRCWCRLTAAPLQHLQVQWPQQAFT